MPIPREDIYDALYQAGKKILESNPCNIQTSAAGTTWHGGKLPNCCCVGCKHLGPTGCTVESLACKLHLCYMVPKDKDAQFIALRLLKETARLHGVPLLARGDKDQTLGVDKNRSGCWEM